MAEWLFLDQSRIIPKHLGVIYRAVVEVCRGEDIEIYIDQLYLALFHAKIHVLCPDLAESSVVWITNEILRQWAQEQKLSVKETKKRLKVLRQCLEKLIEVEVQSVFCLASHLLRCFYIAELKAIDNPEPMTIITAKRLKPGERFPLKLFKLKPLAKELDLMNLRLQILSKRGQLSKWKEPCPVTGGNWEEIDFPKFVGFQLNWKKKLHKSVLRDGKDLFVPVSMSHLVESSQIHNIDELFILYPHLKNDPLFNSFKGYLDEDRALITAVNAAEVEEVKKL